MNIMNKPQLVVKQSYNFSWVFNFKVIDIQMKDTLFLICPTVSPNLVM